MDPHQLPNNLGVPGSQQHQAALQQSYQLFAQQQQPQQYLQQFYQNTPVLQMDTSFFPQQNLFLGVPANQHQAALYQQQLFQQQLLQQQQQQMQQGQQVLQQVSVQQEQNEAQLRQQKLLEQQNRQMAAIRHEQERIQRKQEEEAAREHARRQAELLEQQMREQEAARRLAEEEKKKRMEEEMRQAELRKIRQEEENRRKEAADAENEMKKRSDAIARPLTMVACTPLTKITSLIPFPSENLSSSSASIVSPADTLNALLSSVDSQMISDISNALKNIDVSQIIVRGEGIEEGENASQQHPPLVAALLQHNPSCLNVDEELHKLLSVFEDTDGEDGRRVSSTGGHSSDCPGPSTSTHVPRDENALRKMISLGKQPKAQHNNRKKRDMVESLFDSLTDYFDPSDGRRKRHKVKTYEEEQLEEKEISMVAESEAKLAATAREREKENEGLVADIDEIEGKFFERKKAKKREREIERPPTPTDVLRQRDEEWREREKRRMEKRRKRVNESADDMWSNDVRAENESLTKCTNLIENILDGIEVESCEELDDDSEVPQEMLVDKNIMEELRGEVQKLKMYRKLHEIPSDRLIKLLTVMERNMRDVIATEGANALVPITDEDAGDMEAETFRELVDDRLMRAADAACVALLTMTAHKMPKQVLLEDSMERAVQLCRQYLTFIVYPASDSLYQGVNKGRKMVDESARKRRKVAGSNRSPVVQDLYMRMLELMGCFSELARHHTLPDTLYHLLNTTCLSSFFVNNVGELQLKAMSVLANIFSRADENLRQSVLADLLSSLHRMPPKNANNSYRISGGDVWVGNTTCLFMQLIQSVIKMPKRRKERGGEDDEEPILRDFSKEDNLIKESFSQAKALAQKFLMGFLNKCASKGEEDYRRILDDFLRDLLSSLMSPEWPVAETILNLLGFIISNYYNKKGVDMSVRQTAMEYLGLICARLRKERREVESDTKERLKMIVKTLILYESEEENITIDDINVDHLSPNEHLRKIEQGLIDFLVVDYSNSEVSVEYALRFYVGEWYRMTLEDIEGLKERLKKTKEEAESDKEKRKADRKLEKAAEKANKQREFLIDLSDKKNIKKRTDAISRSNATMLNSDAAWVIKHLAMQRDFCNNLDNFLKQILVGVTTEPSVGLRTRAMKSLTQIIEVDYTVLAMTDVRRAVHTRMTDPNAAVREATIELLGKFVLARPDLVEDYYQIILERIKDSGTAVRKRVIRIIREYCEKRPDYLKVPEMLSRIIRRVNDEEGVKKLVVETFHSLWMQAERQVALLDKKVLNMTSMVTLCMKEPGGVECIEAVLSAILKGDSADKSAILAAKQIVDSLVDYVIQLESDNAKGTMQEAEALRESQENMLSSLTTLSVFSKVRPEMLLKHAETLQPYLSMSAKTPAEQNVLNQVITMLERVLPLMQHPSQEFVCTVDKNLGNLARSAGMVITSSSISCAAALYNKSPRYRPSMTGLFLQYIKALNLWRRKLDQPGMIIDAKFMPMIQRSVYTMGLLTRYFDWDIILDGDAEASSMSLLTLTHIKKDDEDEGEDVSGRERRALRDNVFVLLTFFSGHQDESLRHKAITSLGHLCAEYPEYLQRPEVMKLYMYVMRSHDDRFLQLKIQTLRNLELFLTSEEKKMMMKNQDWEKVKDEQDLKEMELMGSGLGSAVIQKYWPTVLETYFDGSSEVRTASMQVVWQTLSQGLVTPGNSIHVLIAMSTDPLIVIRHRVENLVKDIDTKYQGMVQSKAVQGIRAAFKLQSTIHRDGSVIRGIRAVDQTATANAAGRSVPMGQGAPKWTNDGQALLSALYQSLRTSRMQRRSVLTSMLRLFSDDCRERLSIEEWIFVADNIAMFPYQVIDEPLYVMHTIDSIVALSGQSIVNQFKTQLLPSQAPPGTSDDDLEFEPDALYRRLPMDKSVMYELMDNSQACFTLLYLKTFLMKLYAISDAKVQEYSPSEAAKVYEKSVTRKNIHMFHPHTGMQQLQPEVRGIRNTPQGDWQLVQHVSQFRRMLLSLDRVEEEEEDGKGEESEEGNESMGAAQGTSIVMDDDDE